MALKAQLYTLLVCGLILLLNPPWPVAIAFVVTALGELWATRDIAPLISAVLDPPRETRCPTTPPTSHP